MGKEKIDFQHKFAKPIAELYGEFCTDLKYEDLPANTIKMLKIYMMDAIRSKMEGYVFVKRPC
jgi:hypothetical protein